MSHDAVADRAAPQPDDPYVIELIPGEDVLIVLDPAAGIPDEDAIDELRIQAHERRGAAVMGPGMADAMQALAGWAASGVVGGAAFAPFPATWAYIQRWRARHRPARVSLDHAIETAVGLCPTALRRQPQHCEVVQSDKTEDDGWRLLMVVDSVEYEFTIDSTGGVASFVKLTGRRRPKH